VLSNKKKSRNIKPNKQITIDYNSKCGNDEVVPKISLASKLVTQQNKNEYSVPKKILILENKKYKNLSQNNATSYKTQDPIKEERKPMIPPTTMREKYK
jgi:hypothetical protein